MASASTATPLALLRPPSVPQPQPCDLAANGGDGLAGHDECELKRDDQAPGLNLTCQDSNIEEDGTIYISCVGGDGHLRAKEMIDAMTQPPEIGRLYKESKVVSAKEFGVFVEIVPGVEGLCHISELSEGYVKRVEEVCKVGDVIPVKLISIDDQGRYKLSRKAALAEMGLKEERKPRPEGRQEGREHKPKPAGRR
jgi:predicted RNA-binding protein with RPS1 domain